MTEVRVSVGGRVYQVRRKDVLTVVIEVNRPGLEPMIYLTHVVAIFGSNCTLSFYLASLILPLTFSITTVRTSLGRT
jgi:hypothetical protein